MILFRNVLLAALAVPLAFGEYSYTYDYTDAPTAAPTSLTAPPTTSGAPTRMDTYAPTRLTETPSYAPTTETYAPTAAPTATAVPSSAPTQCSLLDKKVPDGTDINDVCNEPGYNVSKMRVCGELGRGVLSPPCEECTAFEGDADQQTGTIFFWGCCNASFWNSSCPNITYAPTAAPTDLP